MNWTLNADNLQVHYLKRRQLIQLQEADQFPYASLEANLETSIVRPFHVNCDAKDEEVPETGASDFNRFVGSAGTLIRTINVQVSSISLNLVDAESVARSIGKWYGQGILSVRSRATQSKRHASKRSQQRIRCATLNFHGAFQEHLTPPPNLNLRPSNFQTNKALVGVCSFVISSSWNVLTIFAWKILPAISWKRPVYEPLQRLGI